MNVKKIITLLLAALLMLSLAACGAQGGDSMDAMNQEPKNAKEALALHKTLMEQENTIFSENTEL